MLLSSSYSPQIKLIVWKGAGQQKTPRRLQGHAGAKRDTPRYHPASRTERRSGRALCRPVTGANRPGLLGARSAGPLPGELRPLSLCGAPSNAPLSARGEEKPTFPVHRVIFCHDSTFAGLLQAVLRTTGVQKGMFCGILDKKEKGAGGGVLKRFGATAGSARGGVPCGRCPPRRCKRDETARGWRAAGMSPPARGKGAAGRKKPLRLKHSARPQRQACGRMRRGLYPARAKSFAGAGGRCPPAGSNRHKGGRDAATWL